MFMVWSTLQSESMLRCDDKSGNLISSDSKSESSMQTCSGGTNKYCPSLHFFSSLSTRSMRRGGKMMRLITMFAVIVGVTATGGEQNTCVMRGVCAEVQVGQSAFLTLPCATPSKPEQLKSESLRRRLQETCPMYRANDAVCCDDDNVQAMFESFDKASQLIAHCPVCYRNFIEFWCQYTCSPRQNEFLRYKLNPSRIPKIEGAENKRAIVRREGPLADSLDFFIDTAYAKSVFESCVKVQFGSQSSLQLMCSMPAECVKEELNDKCLKDCLFDMGVARVSKFQPTNISFIFNDEERPLPSHVRPLSMGLPLQRCEESSLACEACSCSDCFGACAPTSPFLREIEMQWSRRKGITVSNENKKKNESQKGTRGIEVTSGSSFIGALHNALIFDKSPIFGYPYIAVILFTICFIAAVLILALCFMCDARKGKGENEKEHVKFAGTYWGARDLLDNVQRGGAEWYAKVVADHTFWIGALTILIVGVVCLIGLPMQSFIMDPIDVWTQSDSRSRIEKATFEHYFNATPRYTQVVIRPIQSFARPYQYGNKNYGPIFHHFVMQQAFELTQELIDLKGKGVNPITGKELEVSLKDACYKMVDDHCFFISPMSYLQNNRTVIDCTDRACVPEMDRMMEEVKREHKKKKEEEKKEKKGGKEKLSFLEEARIALQVFNKMFNGTKKVVIVEDPKEDENVFDDFYDFKRRKRESPVHNEHRVRTKRHQTPYKIEVSLDSNHPDYADRLSQKWEMDKGIGVLRHIVKCVEIPVASSAYLNLQCGSQMGGAPIPGNLVFGGWHMTADPGLSEVKKIAHYSNAYVITIGLDSNKKELAEIWEKAVIELLKRYSNEYVAVNFITELSIEDEINAAAQSDVRIVAIGYALMAIYIIFGLSQFSVDNRRGVVRHTIWYQVFPGVMVSITISLSVAFVIAVYGIIGLHATLMCMEVQPFLLCAIGVNNIFYFVKTYQRKMHERKQLEAALLSPMSGLVPVDSSAPLAPNNEDESDDESEKEVNLQSGDERIEKEMDLIEDLIRREVLTQTCQRVLPSMFCTAFTECVCFLSLGLSSAPVLKVFSFYASAGVLVNFFFTLMIFVPAFFMAMNFSSSPSAICSPADCVPKAKKEIRRRTRWRFDEIRSSRGWMPHLIEKYYAPIIFTKKGRYASILIQFLLISVAIIFIPQLPIGLDEKMSVPLDSYVHKFMWSLPDILPSGMPVHFVVHSKSGKALDVDDERFVKLFCTRADCDKNSLGNLIAEAVKVTKTDLISQPAMNWMDDYRQFRSVSKSSDRSCCLINRSGGYCTVEEVEGMGGRHNSTCRPCLDADESHMTLMTRDLLHFTHLLPTMTCGMSGGMAHREAISFTDDGKVNAFYLRSFHRTFRNSSDYIAGLRLTRMVSEEFKKVLDLHGYKDVQVFPYAFYYVFYDQYLYIAFSTSSQLALSAGIAFIGLCLTTVSPTTALIVALNTLSATLLLIGYMVWRSIELNALTIVNLAMSLGIDLEFFAHLCFAYANSGRVNRIGRATDALVNVGSTVFSGIIFTKFLGLIVLYNAQSQIFKTYYFDFYLGLLPIGTLHGLVFLPVMLTFWGPDTYLRRYMEQNDRASLTGGADGHTSDEGRPESTSSPRSLILLASAPSSKTTSRGPPTYGRVSAAITPATTQMNTQSNGGSNGSSLEGGSIRRKSSSPLLLSIAPSTIDHESAPLVVRIDSLRNNEAREA